MSQRRRYPGVKPFETAEKNLFFGRDRDIQDLHDLVLLENMVVLFGKSGYGKSSLINAGLIPKLTDDALLPEDQMLPIVVRMRSYTEQENSPVAKVSQQIEEKLEEVGQIVAFDSLWAEKGGQDSLWRTFRRRIDSETPTVLLIFDQFEEFFTYPAGQQARFRQELAELLFTEIPQSLRSNWRELDRNLRRFLSQTMRVKVLFSIRQDKLSLLNGLRDHLPTILQKRYELQGLTQSQAREAIVEPAQLGEGTFASKAFTYETSALDILIRELSQGQKTDPYAAGQAIRIESFLLQICCEFIESRAIETDDQFIEPHDLPDFANIYEAYYNGKVSELSENQQEAARTLMEEGLLYYNPQTSEARRLSVDKDTLLQKYRGTGANQELLDALKNKFLIREERNSVGGFSYEISHDTLLAPILKAREIRQQEAAKRQARKRTLRLVGITGLVGAVAAGAIVLALFAISQRDDAIEARNQAEKLEAKADSTLKVLQAANEARFQENLARGQEFLGVSAYEQAVVAFQAALDFDPGDSTAQAGIALAEEKSGAKETFERRMRRGERQLGNGQILFALTSFQTALTTGYNNAEAQAQIDIAQARLEPLFQRLVKEGDTFKNAGDDESYRELARDRYRQALRIKEDAAVRLKLKEVGG